MLIQFWCNGIISNQVRGFVCSPGFIRDERNEEKWQQYFVITNQANWISQPFIALHSKKSNNPFASVWIVNRGITFYHCSVSDSRVRYFSWPGHGGVTRCHEVSRCHDKQYKCPALRWTNPVQGRFSQAVHWLLKLPEVLGFVNVQCLDTGNDRSNAKTSIQYQLVPGRESRTWRLLVSSATLSMDELSLGGMYGGCECQLVSLAHLI